MSQENRKRLVENTIIAFYEAIENEHSGKSSLDNDRNIIYFSSHLATAIIEEFGVNDAIKVAKIILTLTE